MQPLSGPCKQKEKLEDGLIGHLEISVRLQEIVEGDAHSSVRLALMPAPAWQLAFPHSEVGDLVLYGWLGFARYHAALHVAVDNWNEKRWSDPCQHGRLEKYWYIHSSTVPAILSLVSLTDCANIHATQLVL